MPSPMLTACLQAIALSSISNVVAQVGKSYQDHTAFVFNTAEFLRFAILNAILCPPNYKWQFLLERMLPAYVASPRPALPLTRLDGKQNEMEEEEEEDLQAPAKPKLNIKNTLLKWFIDCMTVGALLNTVGFLILNGLLKSHPIDQIAQTLKTETVPIIVNSYKIWPIASIINFALIPVEKRIVWLSACGLIWGVYLSLVAASI